MRTLTLSDYMTSMMDDLKKFSVGYEPTFKSLDYVRQNSNTGFPPYDLEKTGENQYRLTMAVAGYGEDDIEITQHGDILWIEGNGHANTGNYLHKGIAQRAFRRSFWLDSWVTISSTNLQNGILTVEFLQEVPESHKPRKIPVNFTSTPALTQQ